MKIQINDTWRISTDPHCFIVEKKTIVAKGDNKGKINWIAKGFCSTLEQAIGCYCRQFMLDGDESTISDIKASLGVLTAEIQAVKAIINGMQ